MNHFKHFSCFKVAEKENEKQPDYRLSAKVGEEFVEIGVGWIKEGNSGKFISFKLADIYKDRSGWKIVEEKPDNQATLTPTDDLL